MILRRGSELPGGVGAVLSGVCLMPGLIGVVLSDGRGGEGARGALRCHQHRGINPGIWWRRRRIGRLRTWFLVAVARAEKRSPGISSRASGLG